MFRNTIVLCCVTALLYATSCHKCKNTDFCPLPATGEKYFHNFTEGVSCVYTNRTKTKRDSVYISGYQKLRDYDKLDHCTEWDRIEMKIISQYLSTGEVSCLYENPNCDRSYFTLSIFNCFVDFGSKNGIDSLYSEIQNSSVKKVDSLRLSNNLTYHDVVSYNNRLWFAPDYGLVQYVSYNDVDTFYMDKFYK